MTIHTPKIAFLALALLLTSCTHPSGEDFNEPASAAKEPQAAMNSRPDYESFFACTEAGKFVWNPSVDEDKAFELELAKKERGFLYYRNDDRYQMAFIITKTAAYGIEVGLIHQEIKKDQQRYRLEISLPEPASSVVLLAVSRNAKTLAFEKPTDFPKSTKNIKVSAIRADTTRYIERLYAVPQRRFADLSATLWVSEGVVEEWKQSYTDKESLYSDPRLAEIQNAPQQKISALDHLLRSVSSDACKKFLGKAYADEILMMQGRLSGLLPDRAPFYFESLKSQAR